MAGTGNEEQDSKRSFWENFNPGYVVAGVATVVTSWMSISRNFYKNLHDDGTYAHLENERDLAKQEAKQMAAVTGGVGEFKKYKDKVQQIEKQYADKLRAALREDAGITNSLQKFQVLKRHQQMQVGLTFLTVAAIGAGAVYSFTRSQRLSNKLSKHLARQERRDQEAQMG